jgi:hypothetical protein
VGTFVVNRYYDPTTDQFLSIDPDVAETDQPYVFTNDDPLNAEDPLGLEDIGVGFGPGGDDYGAAGGGTGNDGSGGTSGGEADPTKDASAKIIVSDLKMTDTVEQHTTEYTKDGWLSRPYTGSPLTIQNIIESGNPIPDPGGVPGALRWDVSGTFNGTPGTYELVIDPTTDTILHFQFTSTPDAR